MQIAENRGAILASIWATLKSQVCSHHSTAGGVPVWTLDSVPVFGGSLRYVALRSVRFVITCPPKLLT